jgi:hypothetical protein
MKVFGVPGCRLPVLVGGDAGLHAEPFQTSQPDPEGSGCHHLPDGSGTRRALTAAT